MIGVALCAAVLTMLGIGWLAFLEAGATGTVWCGLGAVVVVALVRRARWPAGVDPSTSREDDDVPSLGGYTGYTHLLSTVGWAVTERRQFERVARPLLLRLVNAAVTERYGAAALDDPDFVRTRVGAQAWQLLDPDQPESVDEVGERAPGPSVDMLTLLVDRIEGL